MSGILTPASEANWPGLRAEYVTNPEADLFDLATRYGIALSVLRTTIDAEHWNDEKDRFVDEVVSEARRRAVAQVAPLAAKHLRELLDSVAKLRRSSVELMENEHRRGGQKLERERETVTISGTDEKTRRPFERQIVMKRLLPDPRFLEAILKIEAELTTALLGVGEHTDHGTSVESVGPVKVTIR